MKSATPARCARPAGPTPLAILYTRDLHELILRDHRIVVLRVRNQAGGAFCAASVGMDRCAANGNDRGHRTKTIISLAMHPAIGRVARRLKNACQ